MFGDDTDWEQRAKDRAERISVLVEKCEDTEARLRDVQRDLEETERREEALREEVEELRAEHPDPVTVEYEKVKEWTFHYTEHDATVYYLPHEGADDVRELDVTFDKMNRGGDWVTFSDYSKNTKLKGMSSKELKPKGSLKHTSIRAELVIAVDTHERKDRELTRRKTTTQTKEFTGPKVREEAEAFVENREHRAEILTPEEEEDEQQTA